MLEYLSSAINWVYFVLAVGYVSTCLAFLFSRLKTTRSAKITIGQFALLGLILIGPPLWFLFEYNHLFLPFTRGKADFKDEFEIFRYNQESAAKVWAGVSTLIVAIALKKEPESSGD